MKKTIIFTFAGRRENMELQIPFMTRILVKNPDVVWHIWNLTGTDEDNEFLRSLGNDDFPHVAGQVKIFHSFHSGHMSWRRFNDVWRHYRSQQYKDYQFVKVDDDVVFIETDGFAGFAEAVRTNPDSVVSAMVINNGACTPLIPDLQATAFEPLDIPLLDVHLHGAFALLSHEWFLGQWQDVVDGGDELLETTDWLSINFIGMSYRMLHRITSAIGKRQTGPIAGRDFPNGRIGDEGAANIFPRLVYRGLVAGHLTFGPQVEGPYQLTPDDWNHLRQWYAKAAAEYLEVPEE